MRTNYLWYVFSFVDQSDLSCILLLNLLVEKNDRVIDIELSILELIVHLPDANLPN